jgi:putative colanic acid biosynthesis glycosyltransferase
MPGTEWIVLDGSADRAAVEALVVGSGLPARYSYRPPAGVYAAMNAALDECAGEYVWFVNAGDEVAGGPTLSRLRAALETDPLWLIGEVAFVDEAGRRTTPPPLDYEEERQHLFARGRFAPHQGTLVRTDWLVDRGGFDTSYRIAADYKVSLQLSLDGEPALLGDVIAEFHRGGVSSTHWKAALGEFHRARREVLHPSGMTALHEAVHTLGQQVRVTAAHALGRA